MVAQKNRPVITFSGKGIDLGQNEWTGVTMKSHKAMLSCDMPLVYLMIVVGGWVAFNLAYAFFGRPDTVIFKKPLKRPQSYELGRENGYKGHGKEHWFIHNYHYHTRAHQERVKEDYKKGQYD